MFISWVLHLGMALAISMTCFMALLTGQDILSDIYHRLRSRPSTILEQWYESNKEKGPARYQPFQPRLSRQVRWRQAIQSALFPALVVLSGLIMLSSAPLIAVYLFAVGAFTYYLARRTQAARPNVEAGRAIADLIRWFKRGFRVDPVVFPVLGDLVRQGKLRPEIAPLVEEAVTRYQKGVSEEQALGVLQGYNVHLDSFAMVLQQASHASADTVLEALEEVRQRLRQHRKFRDAAQTNLAQVRLQFGVMRTVFFAVILACVSSSALRDFYTVTLNRQFLFMGIVTLGVAGVAYFNQEIYHLQFQAL